MMSRLMLVLPAVALMAAGAAAREKKVELKDLPPAVQAAVQVETKDMQIFTISQEEEDGKTFYEVETEVNGLERDVSIDASGIVVEVEEEIEPARLPEAARKAVEGVAGGGTIKKVEAITKDGATEYVPAVVFVGCCKKVK